MYSLLAVSSKISFLFAICRFIADESVSGYNQLKSSVVRSIRTKISECYPSIKPYVEDIIPKNGLGVVKWYVEHE